jgi:hypothetical protein
MPVIRRTVRHTVAALTIAALTAGLGMAEASARPPDRPTELRVYPYLQNPGSTTMTVMWFSFSARSGTLILTGPGIRGTRRFTSVPQPQPGLTYTDAERAEQIPGLTPGSWLLRDGNVKHVIELTGLRPGTRYHYEVRQGRDRYVAHLQTAPSSRNWNSIRFVAMSDHETEPRDGCCATR